MTDREIIAAIRRKHIRANIGAYEDDPSLGTIHWDEAYLDWGGTWVFGPGPYLHVPITMLENGVKVDRIVVRVYPPARLQRRLARSGTKAR